MHDTISMVKYRLGKRCADLLFFFLMKSRIYIYMLRIYIKGSRNKENKALATQIVAKPKSNDMEINGERNPPNSTPTKNPTRIRT